MKRFLMAAFIAVFFVSGSMAQEMPRAKPAERAAPDCITSSDFLQDYKYSMGYHNDYKSGVFAYVETMDVIVILPMAGPCLNSNAALVLKRGMPAFGRIYRLIMAGWGI